MPSPNDPASLSSDSNEGAKEMVIKLIEGITSAFDRDPDAFQCPENERTRLAEALYSIASFILKFPNLGPTYANHFAELGTALKDWNKGANPRLFDRQKGSSTPLPTLESRARVNIVLAIEALTASGISLSDRNRSIDDMSGAISEFLSKFPTLKNWVKTRSRTNASEADIIRNWQGELSRKGDRKGVAANDEANDLLDVGRSFIESRNGNIQALHDFARQRAKWAEREASGLGV
jgi:hypothetical protein